MAGQEALPLIAVCKRCRHMAEAHTLGDVAVGDCGTWPPDKPHPDVQWNMECSGIMLTSHGALPCGCKSFVMQGGTPQPEGHPG